MIDILGFETYYNFKGEVWPTTGIVALHRLFEYPIKELFITGFTLYLDNLKFKHAYYSGYQLDIPASKEVMKNNLRGKDASIYHPPIIHKLSQEYLKKSLDKYQDKVYIDSYLNFLLKANHKNIVKIPILGLVLKYYISKVSDLCDRRVVILHRILKRMLHQLRFVILYQFFQKSKILIWYIKRFMRKNPIQNIKSLIRVIQKNLKK